MSMREEIVEHLLVKPSTKGTQVNLYKGVPLNYNNMVYGPLYLFLEWKDKYGAQEPKGTASMWSIENMEITDAVVDKSMKHRRPKEVHLV